MTAAPPLLAERALALAVGDPEWRDAILGDLREEFLSMARRHGLPYARRWYWTQAVGVAAHRAVARVTGSRRSAPFAMPDPPESRAGSLSLFWHDLRSAWRSLRHQPALSLTVVAMLALGLAANATIFAQADAIVLRPFRYPGVERAAVVASDSHQRFYDRESVAPGDFLDWREQARDVFDRLAAIEWWDPQYLLDGPPQQLTGFLVAPELFEILGESALLGRTLTAADATGQTPVVVLGYEFWRRQFGARPDVLGQQLKLAGVSRQVVGRDAGQLPRAVRLGRVGATGAVARGAGRTHTRVLDGGGPARARRNRGRRGATSAGDPRRAAPRVPGQPCQARSQRADVHRGLRR